MKIAIIGYTGAGKSSLSKKIAKKYKYPLLHLDTIHFLANWVRRNKEEARNIEKEFRQHDNWIIEGNFQSLNNFDRFKEADQIIFLKVSRFKCLFRVLKRYYYNRHHQRDDLAKGSYDRLTFSFLKWILWSGRQGKWTQFYQKLEKDYPDKFLTLSTNKDIKDYLSQL